MLTLYEHPFALYCQKVLIALNELGVAYDVLEEQRDFDRAELAQLWPPASIPVLRAWDPISEGYISDSVQAIVADTYRGRFDASAVADAQGRLEMAYGMLDAQL